ncbi:hypothetical protein Tco_0153402 [Tanacetum coccineum]
MEDGSKYRLTFMLDKKMLSLTLDDFRTIFHLQQATDNNHDRFVPPPSFLDMVSFYKNELGFTMELKTSSSFKTTGLLQPWQTLCKIFSKCLTTRVTGWDQSPLQIMQMMYCFINNIHVDYVELLWEGLYYSLHHPTSSIPYPRFTKIIISHYMTNFPEISRRARDIYHNLKDDDIMKNIFNSRRHKDRVGMKIPDWMISDEMKHTEHYQMYAEVFGIDVPLTQSQPTESTQGTHRTPSAHRISTRLTPPAPVPTIDKADEMILQDTLQLKPRSDKESPEVEITNVVIHVNVNEEEEEITNEVYELKRREKGMIIEESRSTPSPTPIRSPRIYTDLVSSDTEKLQELTETGTTPTPSSSSLNTKKSFDTLADHLQEVMVESLPAMVDKHIKEQVEKQVPEQVKVQVLVHVTGAWEIKDEISSQIQQAIDNHIPFLVDASVRNYMSRHILHVHLAQPQTTSVPEQQYQLYLSMKNNPQLQQHDIAIWLALQMKFETLQVPQTTCITSVVRLRDQDEPHDNAPPERENSNQEQVDDYDFWTESYASDDDEIPTKQVSQDIMEEVSLTINEAELKKITDEMLRKRCTSGDEHQYHIDQIKNFLKSDIVWESRKEILASPHPRKTTPLVQSCQRDPEAPALSLINQDLLYLKKENLGPEKIVMSLHKFPAINFNDVDIEERTSRWFITKIVARRANECIVSITESDYKNLNKNDIKDIYLLIMNDKVPDYAETGIEKYKIFSIIYEPVHGIIYKNSKKEKRVMRHSEIHKFCDATLNRVLEGLKSYNNDIKYDYIQRDLTEDEVGYLKLFEEEIEVGLKYRNQMRRWKMYVNGRPLGPRRERPE